MSDDEFEARPGHMRDRGRGSARPKTLVAQVKALTNRSGRVGYAAPHSGSRGSGASGRGRTAALRTSSRARQRRAIVKARIVRHAGTRFSAAPLGRHLTYLQRDGVTRDGKNADLFGSGNEPVDGKMFAERCAGDRHHFRFIVSPEDASQMADLRAFTRELMDDMARDLDTKLDWVAVDHWNTDNPHIHILLRGKADNGQDLVIDKDYIRDGMRGRAETRATIELGQRTESEIAQALAREVEADRWTSLDNRLRSMAHEHAGLVDLRPDGLGGRSGSTSQLKGRATKLERLGLADRIAPACWTLKPDLEQTLRQLGTRGDIIKTMHRAIRERGHPPDVGRFVLQEDTCGEPVFGRLVERGLHDELTGSAYAIVDGADGRSHYLQFGDIDMTGDARPGALVEQRQWIDNKGRQRQSLAVRSDLSLGAQVGAEGATWLDRQLVAKEPLATGDGFGTEIRDAMTARAEHLVSRGLAHRQGQRIIFTRAMLDKLQSGELSDTLGGIAERTGLAHRPSAPGEYVTGIYRERVNLASGRFAMIDDGMAFQLVPWRPALDRHLGQAVTGTMNVRGGVDWSFGRSRGIGI